MTNFNLQVQVEMQEDDLSGQTPDSRLTHATPVALIAHWKGDPSYNQNRFWLIRLNLV